MAVKRKVKRRKKKKGLIQHLVSLGFSNRLAIYILLFLAAGLAGGFYLANESIRTGYTGAKLKMLVEMETASNLQWQCLTH